MYFKTNTYKDKDIHIILDDIQKINSKCEKAIKTI